MNREGTDSGCSRPEGSVPANVPASPSAARQRTLRHLRGLLAKAVAGAALGATGCDPPPIVCDPLPPPVDCTDLAAGDVARWLTGDATWIGTAAEAGIRVRLSFYGSEVTFVGSPTVDAGTTQDVEADMGELTFTYVPAAGVETARVSVMVQCRSDSATVVMMLDLQGTAAPGVAVPLTFDP
jgi:hypothetical protein